MSVTFTVPSPLTSQWERIFRTYPAPAVKGIAVAVESPATMAEGVNVTLPGATVEAITRGTLRIAPTGKGVMVVETARQIEAPHAASTLLSPFATVGTPNVTPAGRVKLHWTPAAPSLPCVTESVTGVELPTFAAPGPVKVRVWEKAGRDRAASRASVFI
jgi:hypothetical protein